jgi:hypothetical protein
MPLPSEIKEGATSIIELNATQMTQLQMLREDFKENRREYEAQTTKLNNLHDFLISTVASHNHVLFENQRTLYGKLSALKARLAPTDRARKVELRAEYNKLLTVERTQDTEKWLQDWVRVVTEARTLGLAQVQDSEPLHDFLNAVEQLDAGFAYTKQNDIEKSELKGEPLPDIFELIDAFTYHRRLRKTPQAANKSHTNTAFATTFHGEEQGKESQQPQQKQPWGKRSDSPKPFGNCVCGQPHRFGSCNYLIPSIRPSNWKPNPQIENSIKEKLEKNSRLAANVEKARRWAANQIKTPENKKQEEGSDKPPAYQNPVNLATEYISDVKTMHAAFATQEDNLDLANSCILDTGSSTHVCNDNLEFVKTRDAGPDEYIKAGKGLCKIEAFGTAKVTLKGPDGPILTELRDTAYVPGFLTNCISAQRLKAKGVYYDPRRNRLERDGKTFVDIIEQGGLLLLAKELKASSFATTTSKPRPEKAATVETWHKVLGHAGRAAIEHLQEAVIGASITDDVHNAPTTRDCEDCSLSKAHQIVSRRTEHEEEATQPLERNGYDLIPMEEAYNGDKWVSHFFCFNTKMNFVYTHPRKSDALKIVEAFVQMAKTRFGKQVKFIRIDDEQTLATAYNEFTARHGITTERAAPYSKQQNGGAERSGGVLVTKARTMRIAAGLPTNLWPETMKAAGYTANRTPTKALDWKTPFEALTGKKPTVAHMHTYGCKAYPLRGEGTIPRLQRLEPRAFIGYLLGYDSTNVFRVWMPSRKKIIRVRDVTFKENEFYQPLEPDMGVLEEERQLVELIEEPDVTPENGDESEHLLQELHHLQRQGPQQEHTTEHNPQPQNTQQTNRPQQPLLSPPTTRDGTPDVTGTSKVSADFNTGNILPEGSKRIRRQAGHIFATKLNDKMYGFHHSFATGLEKTEARWHRDALPTEPKGYKTAMKHLFATGWRAAAEKEIATLERKHTYKFVPQELVLTKQILPLTWVFKYKFDTEGFLVKLKARICVRGDLQTTEKDTYAATLTARIFRALISLATAFDMELRQYDAVNAFTNADLDEEVFCHPPEGFENPGYVILLQKALYGLKRSPTLWHKDLSLSLEKMGLHPVGGVNCLFISKSVIVFFYVDDIVAACLRKDIQDLNDFEAALMKRYEIQALGDLKWFLGIRVIRDRTARKTWLVQDSYIDKIATKFHCIKDKDKCPITPLTIEELLPNEGKATDAQIHMYQQRVGSINFPAVITRPDIAFAASKLAQFLTNPSSAHIRASERVISYLYGTRTLGLEYSGTDFKGQVFECSSDSAFADDSITRRSSCGYIFQLYGGPVDWRAFKQQSVTTSSTEAELLALSSTAKETLGWIKFFEAIDFDLGEDLTINCDNLQTIRLLTKEAPKLDTKLKHVDIHQHWLRQEVQEKHINVKWVKSEDMVADGLTKALPKEKHAQFIILMNMKLAPITAVRANNVITNESEDDA